MKSAAPSNRRRRPATQALIAVAICAVLVVGAALVWRQDTGPSGQLSVAILLDASATAGQERRCADALRIGRQIYDSAAGRIRLCLFATGNRRTGGEPARLGVVTRERRVTLLEQNGDQLRERFLRQIERLCESVRPSQESPIFRAVASVATTLPADQCSRPGNACQIWVRTDGIEESDPWINASLRQRPRRKAKRTVQHRPRIDNSHILVRFCGLSERRIRRRSRRLPSLDRVVAVFRREFTHPEAVRFEAICAPYETAGRVLDRQEPKDKTERQGSQ